jgi:hypothetical protein
MTDYKKDLGTACLDPLTQGFVPAYLKDSALPFFGASSQYLIFLTFKPFLSHLGSGTDLRSRSEWLVPAGKVHD